jgi:hypothetical protein
MTLPDVEVEVTLPDGKVSGRNNKILVFIYSDLCVLGLNFI